MSKNSCGNCLKWMKKHHCPKEKGVMNGGPSSNTPSCDQFLSKSPTGRLVYFDPPMQNIQIRTEEGAKIRQAFLRVIK